MTTKLFDTYTPDQLVHIVRSHKNPPAVNELIDRFITLADLLTDVRTTLQDALEVEDDADDLVEELADVVRTAHSAENEHDAISHILQAHDNRASPPSPLYTAVDEVVKMI